MAFCSTNVAGAASGRECIPKKRTLTRLDLPDIRFGRCWRGFFETDWVFHLDDAVARSLMVAHVGLRRALARGHGGRDGSGCRQKKSSSSV